MGLDSVVICGPDVRAIDAAQVRRLLDGAGWGPNRDADEIREAVVVSVSLGAWDGERMVGYAGALSDGKYVAYVDPVVIDPEYRGRGIGERLVAALCRELADIQILYLFCRPERVAFYERNGFVRHGRQVMMHREAKRG